MKRRAAVTLVISCAVIWTVRADTVIEQVQRTLKDQGFYYGEVTGQMDSDTTAAIRRYQIRSGLNVTGQLDAETQKALGLSGGPAAKPTPRPQTTPAVRATQTPAPANENEAPEEQRNSQNEQPPSMQPPPHSTNPDDEYAPEPHSAQPLTSGGVFAGTAYAVAPPEVQQRILIEAQTFLSNRGYYRSEIDGVYGPSMQFSLRAFQSDTGLAPSGRLDMETLAALHLLPGERRFGPPRRRYMRPPIEVAPNGEPIYVPND